jgi:hypothetical protein
MKPQNRIKIRAISPPSKTLFTRLHCTVLRRSHMRPRHKPIRRQVLIEVRQQLRCTGGVAPVTHEIRGEPKVGLDLHAGDAHTVERLASDTFVEGTGCFGGDIDRVPFLDKRHREELDADLADVVRTVDMLNKLLTSVVMPATMICFLPVA